MVLYCIIIVIYLYDVGIFIIAFFLPRKKKEKERNFLYWELNILKDSQTGFFKKQKKF